ncbi:N-acetylmuramic acid 6-phosphate etherase [Loktanella atrilutea]|uniref:N-acetylmuramic acid 6-phosphate etherase n=1 Tax=Loktanella atrilutea TaxID=366533 RepID=A0A1M5D7Q6_LOKAT|nr:N-acetylmuramic acid 6-phosphate etherase [Loktanella atrilutea]SHF62905.1 N-acetylmuramic acid 6-phosphate etherase [Loktanella atrilutea]
MALPRTEARTTDETAIDRLDGAAALTRMIDVQIESLATLRAVLPALDAAADLVAETLRGSGRLVYAAAGSSGLMALADASELPGTFGIDPDRIAIRMAGGIPTDARMPGDTEDLVDAGLTLRPGDLLIAISASGSTRWAVDAAARARADGVPVIGIANNPDTPLLQTATVAICLATPPEVLAGSTRMGAGTAQKAALNLISTLAGVRLGHVHDGDMVNLRVDNAKLRNRAARIVAHIARVSDAVATQSLNAARYDTKTACLIAAGASPAAAIELLTRHQGHLRPALAALQDQDAR